MVKKILILAANPRSTARLRLDQEIREIEEGLRRASHRNRFEIQTRHAVNNRDIRRAMLEYKPHILHFTGHGKENGIYVEGEEEFPAFVSTDALAHLFSLFPESLECVVLSSCYSASQADAIKKHVKFVIGMESEIKDKAAIEFAVGFYDALGAGKPVEDAFEFGCNAIMLAYPELPDHLLPVLKKGKDGRKPANESNETPLVTRPWDLSPKTFTALCADITATFNGVIAARLSGKQEQEGVDVTATFVDGSLLAARCRSGQSLTAAAVKNAAHRFLSSRGSYGTAKGIDRFLLMSSCNISGHDAQRAVHQCRRDFENEGIRFVLWEKARIERYLADHPAIVARYFQPDDWWVEKLCHKKTSAVSPAADPWEPKPLEGFDFLKEKALGDDRLIIDTSDHRGIGTFLETPLTIGEGQLVTIQYHSDFSGHIILIEVNPRQHITCLRPSRFMPGTLVQEGHNIFTPSSIPVGPPFGTYTLYAVFTTTEPWLTSPPHDSVLKLNPQDLIQLTRHLTHKPVGRWYISYTTFRVVQM